MVLSLTKYSTSLSSFQWVINLLGHHLLQAGQYIMNHKSRMKMVPIENCDVVMTFADTTDDHTLLWLLNQIRLGIPQIVIQIRQHNHNHEYAFFITSTFENLLCGAEQMGMQKTVKPQFGGGTRRFSCAQDDIYENIESELCFFTSQERQNIIRYWLDNLRAKQGDILHNISFLEGQPIIPELKARGVIIQLFPLHEQRILSQLMTSWVQAVCERQPLDDICDYFGVKIAMYFAWLGFYTNSMLYPAVVGFLLWILSENDQTSQDVCCVVFALFNVVWATLFLERWKRREAELAYKWGTLDTPAEPLEEPRPQFRGVKRRSPVTGCEEFYYPPWKRRAFCWLVSLPICILCLCFVCLAMFICLELQEFVTEMKGLPSVTRFIPKILLAITVSTCDEVYKKIAVWLNDMENYRLQSTYENNLIIKTVFFQFINSYLSLFYIGFYLKDMERLREMLATLLIFRQFLQNIKEVLHPYLYEHHKLGVFRTLWDLMHTLLFKYGNLAVEKAQMTYQTIKDLKKPGNQPVQTEKIQRTSLIAGDRTIRAEDCDDDVGLKQRKVSFTEKVECKTMSTQIHGIFLDDGSPTLVEEGMDFEICDDEEIEACDISGNLEGPQSNADFLKRRKTQSKETEHTENKKISWIDPPEEVESTVLTQPEIESCMLTYEDTLQDYQEMFIQFGYVVLFSSAFPLAAMCALINNIIEIRSDALKLCTGLQRPFGQRVENIGHWQTAMEAMGLIAIIVNCYLIGQCGQLQRLFPWLSPEMTIVSIVILEHFAILLKYIIHMAIPDIPEWVVNEMAKLEYRRREALKRHERLAQQQHQQQQKRRREEEEHQRLARQNSQSDKPGPGGAGDYQQEKSSITKTSSGGSVGDKPKRPSSLLGNNNVMKLKQIIPLQSKFTSSTSPTSNEPKHQAFLSFKFLKSPEGKKDASTGVSASALSSTAASAGQEKSQSFNPGKLFNFAKAEGASCVSGEQLPKQGDVVRASNTQHTNDNQTGAQEEMLVPKEDKESTDSGSNTKKKQ
ncbi:anoctamin-8 [Chanos chanos]|uniref:Anoctamin n=1 Tax=Chanos chanos TaxID=29144 RepID=A0A6J2VGX9_CHACN|nr:anoctamin-8-like [Chanos chanos]